MRPRLTARPAPAMSMIAAVVGIFMLLVVSLFFASHAKAVPWPMLLFVAFWLVALVGVIVYHIVNAARPGGVPTQIIESEDAPSNTKTSAERLQELEDLRNRKLISDEECESKRAEVLNKI